MIPGLLTVVLTVEDINANWSSRNHSTCCPINVKLRSILCQVDPEVHLYVSLETAWFELKGIRYEYKFSPSLNRLNNEWASDLTQTKAVAGYAYLFRIKRLD